MKHLKQLGRNLKGITVNGRASLSEFVIFELMIAMCFIVLFIIISQVLLSGIETPTNPMDYDVAMAGKLGSLFMGIIGANLLMSPLMILNIFLIIRRLHDINISGLWLLTILIPGIGFVAMLIILILALIPGNKGDNKYGPAPILTK